MKFGRVLGAHPPLPSVETRRFLEAVEQRRFGGAARNQLDQVHVARRVEEVDAAETVAQVFREGLGERVNRKAGGVGREDRVRADVWRNLLVQIGLPVYSFCNRLDDQVALAQFFQVLLVIGGLDERDLRGTRGGRGVELPEVCRAPCSHCRSCRLPSRASRTAASRTLALTRCAAICAPITPAPSTATLRMWKFSFICFSPFSIPSFPRKRESRYLNAPA